MKNLAARHSNAPGRDSLPTHSVVEGARVSVAPVLHEASCRPGQRTTRPPMPMPAKGALLRTFAMATTSAVSGRAHRPSPLDPARCVGGVRTKILTKHIVTLFASTFKTTYCRALVRSIAPKLGMTTRHGPWPFGCCPKPFRCGATSLIVRLWSEGADAYDTAQLYPTGLHMYQFCHSRCARTLDR